MLWITFKIQELIGNKRFITERRTRENQRVKRNNSTATPYDDTSEEKLWQKSRCLYHMQTRAATAASPA